MDHREAASPAQEAEPLGSWNSEAACGTCHGLVPYLMLTRGPSRSLMGMMLGLTGEHLSPGDSEGLCAAGLLLHFLVLMVTLKPLCGFNVSCTPLSSCILETVSAIGRTLSQ